MNRLKGVAVQYSKLKISADATSKLRTLRQRTGLTPNLLCRIAIMISLEEGPIRGAQIPDENGSEFNAYTLTGEYSTLFSAFLRWREEGANPAKPLDDDELVRLLRAHISRGIGTLSVRAKSPVDLLQLVPFVAAA